MVAPTSTMKMTLNEAISIITLHPDFDELKVSKVYRGTDGGYKFRANIYNDEEFCGEQDLAQDAIIELAGLIEDDKAEF